MNAKILIVEDEGLIALDLKKKLEQAGYTVPAIVDNGDDAILSVERLQPSLVLMDIRLRGPMDGVATAEQIRQRFHVPVIFVTAHADRETLDRAKITEPFGYLVKPLYRVDFRAQIETALWKHKMEQKVRVSEAWFSTTFQNVADGLIATDEAGNIALMNEPAALLTGWDREEAKGRPLTDVFRAFEESTGLPISEPVFDEAHGKSGPGQSPRTFKLNRRGGVDSVIEAEFSANSDEGKTFGLIVAFRDVTERRRLERQDRQLQKMNALSLMATGLGRELAESQRRMDDSLKALIEQSEGETSRLLWDVYEHSSHQQSIVHQLIMMGKSDAVQTVVVDLNEILSELREQLRKALGVHRTLRLKLQPGIPRIQTDPRQLRENLLRLVADCRQSTVRGGLVEISTAAFRLDDKATVQLVIQDDRRVVGAGAKDRVFDPYYQAFPGKRNPGFSLALVSQFVALSGGTIKVEATPGMGSAYLLSLPAVSDVPVLPGTGNDRTGHDRRDDHAVYGAMEDVGYAVA